MGIDELVLDEDREEKVAETAKKFFKEKLKIEKPIELADAYRVDKGKVKTIVIRLQNVKDRGLIFGHVKNLKDVNNKMNKPFQIREHLSPKEFAARKRQSTIISKNEKLSAAEQLVVNMERAGLIVDGELYVKEIRPPPHMSRNVKSESLAKQLAVQVSEGETQEVDNQKFIGYTACVKDMSEVNAGYAKVQAMNTSARHVLAACALPGREFHILHDSNDDDEHGVSEQLLAVLEGSNIKNRAVYVA